MDASIPQPPDKAWTLAEKDGSSEIVLTRQYKGEQITVTANINPDVSISVMLPLALLSLCLPYGACLESSKLHIPGRLAMVLVL